MIEHDHSKNSESKEPIDEWEARIKNTGCLYENTVLQNCFYEQKDWRLCQAELLGFRKCWIKHKNDQRTDLTKGDPQG